MKYAIWMHLKWTAEELDESTSYGLASSSCQSCIRPRAAGLKAWFRKSTTNHAKYQVLSHMGISKNNGTPKSSILIGFSIINHPFWGTIIFGNPIHESTSEKKLWDPKVPNHPTGKLWLKKGKRETVQEIGKEVENATLDVFRCIWYSYLPSNIEALKVLNRDQRAPYMKTVAHQNVPAVPEPCDHGKSLESSQLQPPMRKFHCAKLRADR